MSQVPRDQTRTPVPSDRQVMVLSPLTATLVPAQTLQLMLSGAPGAPKWTSSRTSVATVSRTGLVRAVALGVTVINVKAGKAAANATITVGTAPPVVVPPTAVLTLSGSEQNPISVSTVGTTGGTAAIASGSITWGDGQTTTFTGPPDAVYSHSYQTAAGYTITLTVLTTTALSSNDPLSVTIPAVAPPNGTVIFNASPDHADVISYEARLHPIGSSVILDSVNLGKPTPVAGVITVDLTAFFAQQALGVYTLTVAAISAGGTTDSMYSNEFSLPLP